MQTLEQEDLKTAREQAAKTLADKVAAANAQAEKVKAAQQQGGIAMDKMSIGKIQSVDVKARYGIIIVDEDESEKNHPLTMRSTSSSPI